MTRNRVLSVLGICLLIGVLSAGLLVFFGYRWFQDTVDHFKEAGPAIDAKAKRVGLSRSEYLRRALEREHTQAHAPVDVDQLAELAVLVQDLDDPDVMTDAWS